MTQASALVVYDGTDRDIGSLAEVFATQLSSSEPAPLLDVAQGVVPAWDDVRLLVVGTPTIERRASPAVQAWLDMIEPPKRRLAIAVFDTRPHGGWIRTGTGARHVSKHLGRAGFLPNMGAETFYLDGPGGSLEAGELERAAKWALGLGIATGTRQGSAN